MKRKGNDYTSPIKKNVFPDRWCIIVVS